MESIKKISRDQLEKSHENVFDKLLSLYRWMAIKNVNGDQDWQLFWLGRMIIDFYNEIDFYENQPVWIKKDFDHNQYHKRFIEINIDQIKKQMTYLYDKWAEQNKDNKHVYVLPDPFIEEMPGGKLLLWKFSIEPYRIQE